MGKRRLCDEPRCESRQETSYKVARGNSALSIVTMPGGNDTLDTAIMSPGNDILDTVAMARKERENNGQWEAEVSNEGEAGLPQHLIDCKENPGHRKFIPVDQFKVEHLPSGYQDNDLLELVKAVSDLTVRVSVRYVSERRPETVPGSNKPYPCYKNRGSNLVRVGSGWVDDVIQFRDVGKSCDCKECLSSEKPKTNFAHIYICTAAHVVYDELEGEHTTCHLFFDRVDTPDVCSSVVTLSGMARVESYPEFDRCLMAYVTHDLDIIYKLDNTACHRNMLQDKIRNKYNTGFYQADVPTIIVSYPHGCSKQVSVSNISYLNIRRVAQNYCLPYADNLLYTAATCPGSSGACVLEFNRYNFSLSRSRHSRNWNWKRTEN